MAPEAAQTVQAAYDTAARQFAVCNPNSYALYQAATRSLPGGNTRSVLYYDPFPLYMDRAQGCRLWDADGHEYVDMLGEYTAGLYGHSQPVIVQAIQKALARGLSFGSQHSDEARLAALIRERFASIELVRFTNSGTEATLMALAAAKIYTDRSKILVFDGGYHGGGFMFKGGSHPINVPHDYLVRNFRYSFLSLSALNLIFFFPLPLIVRRFRALNWPANEVPGRTIDINADLFIHV